jgi:hypothetical protein
MKKFMTIWLGEPISSIGSSMTAFEFVFEFRKSIKVIGRSRDGLVNS